MRLLQHPHVVLGLLLLTAISLHCYHAACSQTVKEEEQQG